MELVSPWPQRPRFDTVATFNDKKNNNSVNIALKPIIKKSVGSLVKPILEEPQQVKSLHHEPQPVHLRVDKATITDPEDDEEVVASQCQKQMKQKPAGGRLHSVLQSLKSVFHWTTHSISGGMKNSESFILDNGSRRKGYNQLSAGGGDNNNAAESGLDNPSHHSGSEWSTATSSHLTSPISEMDEDSDHSWDDEELTCNVCDRAFSSPRQLEYHQHKKRHWGCNACDSLFSTVMSLEHHKDLYDHWSDEEYDSYTDEDEDDFEDEELYQMDDDFIQTMRLHRSNRRSHHWAFEAPIHHHEKAILLM